MPVADLALRYSRACVLVAVALVIGGVFAAFSLPSSIYPPLQFPRIVIIAHSGTLPSRSMMLIVTRPLEQAALEVPGIRRAARRRREQHRYLAPSRGARMREEALAEATSRRQEGEEGVTAREFLGRTQ